VSVEPPPDRPLDLGKELRNLLGGWSRSPPSLGSAGAAVTVLLREGHDDIEALLLERTVRADDLASGQVSLPGGRVDPGDASLAETALRELREEVGVGATEIVGAPRYVLTQSAPIFGLDVAVFTALMGPSSHGPRVHSQEEVAHVFWLPRAVLADPQRVLRDTSVGPREVDAIIYEGHVIWGFTLRVLRRFFHRTSP
jgi:8-oxo-dGTP pyrophosphatase MutT (NUDIX family)